jgi:hypothetical protein
LPIFYVHEELRNDYRVEITAALGQRPDVRDAVTCAPLPTTLCLRKRDHIGRNVDTLHPVAHFSKHHRYLTGSTAGIENLAGRWK